MPTPDKVDASILEFLTSDLNPGADSQKFFLLDDYDEPLAPEHKNYQPVQTVASHPLAIPDDAVYGPLADIARETYAPMSWAYPAALTVFAGKGVGSSDPNPSTLPVLFTFLLGPPGDGKTTRGKRVAAALGAYETSSFPSVTLVSDRSWYTFAGVKFKAEEAISVPPLLCTTAWLDEGKIFLAKGKIENSSLIPTTCNMWSQRYNLLSDKQGKWAMNAQVSILANLPITEPSEFSELLGKATGGGLYDRLIICPGPQGRWEFDHEHKANVRNITPWPTQIDAVGHGMIREYRQRRAAEGRPIGRLLEIAARVAIISASAAHESIVSIPCLEAAIRFAEWQERVRNVYRNNDAETLEGTITSAIIDGFREVEAAHKAGIPIFYGDPKHKKAIVKDNGWVRFRLLNLRKNWASRWGSSTVTRIKDAMYKSGDLKPGWDVENEKCNHLYRLGDHFNV